VVEAAKARLIARDRLSEAAAFGWRRRRAMDQQMRMGEVARTVLGGEGRTTWRAGS
jgi:AmiR/NasT family two-component response regulator